MLRILEIFEKIIIYSLIVLMAFVLIFSMVDLVYIIAINLISDKMFIMDISEILDIFGLFFLILIGLELMETIKIYFSENIIRIQVVFTVALITIAREVIILDLKETPSLTLIGVGVIIACLSIGYYLVMRIQKDM